MTRSSKPCGKCGRIIKRFRMTKGELLCFWCYRKNFHTLPINVPYDKDYKKYNDTLSEKALLKTYKINIEETGNPKKPFKLSPRTIEVPFGLAGKTIKFVVVDEGEQ